MWKTFLRSPKATLAVMLGLPHWMFQTSTPLDSFTNVLKVPFNMGSDVATPGCSSSGAPGHVLATSALVCYGILGGVVFKIA